MTSSNHTPDTSMDEILASIRRIISEDPDGQAPPASATGPQYNAQSSISSPGSSHVPPARDTTLSNGPMVNGQSDLAQHGAGERIEPPAGGRGAENGIANDIARALAGGSFQEQPRTTPPAGADVSPGTTNLPNGPTVDRRQPIQPNYRDRPVESVAYDATPIGDGTSNLQSFSDVLELQLRSSGTAPVEPDAVSPAGEPTDHAVFTPNPNVYADSSVTDQNGLEGKADTAPPPDPAGFSAWQNGETSQGAVEQAPLASGMPLTQDAAPGSPVSDDQSATASAVDDDVLDLGTMGSIANTSDAAPDGPPAAQLEPEAATVDAAVDVASLAQESGEQSNAKAISGSVFVSQVKHSTATNSAGAATDSDEDVVKAAAENNDQQTGSVNADTQSDGAQTIAAGSLEGTVRELLRPMLQSWLDNNLPSIVDGMLQDQAKSDPQDPGDGK